MRSPQCCRRSSRRPQRKENKKTARNTRLSSLTTARRASVLFAPTVSSLTSSIRITMLPGWGKSTSSIVRWLGPSQLNLRWGWRTLILQWARFRAPLILCRRLRMSDVVKLRLLLKICRLSSIISWKPNYWIFWAKRLPWQLKYSNLTHFNSQWRMIWPMNLSQNW